ncbi:hypothetical protein COLO4_20341 [Corchorus olitorius]|uniref:Uncharacterized protein n=1 Tax=Corchorus olitorius TaxID=93759 RepID=A0A1R3J094_9ROSI|nr:hypothetical protein COLO4_20341 [Corchorus olitorius]
MAWWWVKKQLFRNVILPATFTPRLTLLYIDGNNNTDSQ